MHTKITRALTPIATALLIAFSSHAVMAEKHEHDHEMEQHGSHEHGVARLTMATTDDGLEIALESPAANVFGFEHKAKSEAEHDVVHAALEILKDGSALFAVNEAAACKLESADVESATADSHDEEKHAEGDEHDHEAEKHAKHEDDHDHAEEKKHDDHDHEKEEKHAKHEDDAHDHDKEKKHDDHDHEKEEKHAKHEDDDHDHGKEEKHDDHDHDAHADEESSHSDVEAVWTYHCDKPEAIETVSVKLFSAFPKGFEEIGVEWIAADKAGKAELTEDGAVNLQ